MRKLSGPRMIVAGIAVFALAFVIGVLEHEGNGFWNKVSAVLSTIGVVIFLAGIVMTIARRKRA